MISKRIRMAALAGFLFLAAFLCGCLPKESLELRPGVRWEYVDCTHSKLIFDNGEVLGPADISLKIQNDCIFGSYYENEKKETSFFMFEVKSGKLHRKIDIYQVKKYNFTLDGLYNQVEILGQFKSPEKIGRLLKGEPNPESE